MQVTDTSHICQGLLREERSQYALESKLRQKATLYPLRKHASRCKMYIDAYTIYEQETYNRWHIAMRYDRVEQERERKGVVS
jgi:hypothetical protein